MSDQSVARGRYILLVVVGLGLALVLVSTTMTVVRSGFTRLPLHVGRIVVFVCLAFAVGMGQLWARWMLGLTYWAHVALSTFVAIVSPVEAWQLVLLWGSALVYAVAGGFLFFSSDIRAYLAARRGSDTGENVS